MAKIQSRVEVPRRAIRNLVELRTCAFGCTMVTGWMRKRIVDESDFGWTPSASRINFKSPSIPKLTSSCHLRNQGSQPSQSSTWAPQHSIFRTCRLLVNLKYAFILLQWTLKLIDPGTPGPVTVEPNPISIMMRPLIAYQKCEENFIFYFSWMRWHALFVSQQIPIC